MSSSQDLMQRIANAGARMDPGLSNWDVERLVAGARQRRQFGRARRLVLTTGAAFAGVLALLLLFHGRHVSSRPELTVERLVAQVQAPVADRANAILRLKDGSTAIGLDPATEIRVAQDVADRAELADPRASLIDDDGHLLGAQLRRRRAMRWDQVRAGAREREQHDQHDHDDRKDLATGANIVLFHAGYNARLRRA